MDGSRRDEVGEETKDDALYACFLAACLPAGDVEKKRMVGGNKCDLVPVPSHRPGPAELFEFPRVVFTQLELDLHGKMMNFFSLSIEHLLSYGKTGVNGVRLFMTDVARLQCVRKERRFASTDDYYLPSPSLTRRQVLRSLLESPVRFCAAKCQHTCLLSRAMSAALNTSSFSGSYNGQRTQRRLYEGACIGGTECAAPWMTHM